MRRASQEKILTKTSEDEKVVTKLYLGVSLILTRLAYHAIGETDHLLLSSHQHKRRKAL